MSPWRVGIVIFVGLAIGLVANWTLGDDSCRRWKIGKTAWKARAVRAGRKAMSGVGSEHRSHFQEN